MLSWIALINLINFDWLSLDYESWQLATGSWQGNSLGFRDYNNY
jgi:hypothetical protein